MKGRIIKTYESFNSKNQIPDLGRFSKRIFKTKLTPNPDGTFDYNGGLSVTGMELNSLLELPIRLNRVGGDFYCDYNNLISLEGSPKIVGGSFFCSGNKLISLQYAPEEVNNEFYSIDNYLLSTKCETIFVNGALGNKKIDKNFKRYDFYGNVKEILKRMTFDQRIKELEFFKRNDRTAFEIMKEILIKENLGFGEETKKIVGVLTKDFTNAKEMF